MLDPAGRLAFHEGQPGPKEGANQDQGEAPTGSTEPGSEVKRRESGR